MAYIDFLGANHKSTKRDYVGRVNEIPKAEAAARAKKYDFDYWDGDRKFGYGGYKYDGRWQKVANALVEHYGLKAGDKVLDVGCGKGFLMHDLLQAVPGIEVKGIDISEYAIEHAKEEVKPLIDQGNAKSLPYEDNSFDLVISLNAIHNLPCYEMLEALKEIERVGKDKKYLVVESYRNLEERTNLLYWVLTGECFFAPEEWDWFYKQAGYTGDHSYIYFE